MNRNIKPLARSLAISLALTGGFGFALAQGNTPAGSADAPGNGQAVFKVLLENEKVLVYENIFAPGDAIPSQFRAHRVVQYLDSGTLRRTMADGTTGDRVVQPGEVAWVEAGTFSVTNIGGTTVRVVVTELK